MSFRSRLIVAQATFKLYLVLRRGSHSPLIFIARNPQEFSRNGLAMDPHNRGSWAVEYPDLSTSAIHTKWDTLCMSLGIATSGNQKHVGERVYCCSTDSRPVGFFDVLSQAKPSFIVTCCD